MQLCPAVEGAPLPCPHVSHTPPPPPLFTAPPPGAVLEWAECREVRDPENTNLLWRGLRVKMGVSYGVPSSKAPLNTGKRCRGGVGGGVGTSTASGTAQLTCLAPTPLALRSGSPTPLPDGAGAAISVPYVGAKRQAVVPFQAMRGPHPSPHSPPSGPAGRADYFGSVPNLAARLMAVARPGQMLVDGRLHSMRDLQASTSGTPNQPLQGPVHTFAAAACALQPSMMAGCSPRVSCSR